MCYKIPEVWTDHVMYSRNLETKRSNGETEDRRAAPLSPNRLQGIGRTSQVIRLN
jgi:hypothetical protein